MSEQVSQKSWSGKVNETWQGRDGQRRRVTAIDVDKVGRFVVGYWNIDSAVYGSIGIWQSNFVDRFKTRLTDADGFPPVEPEAEPEYLEIDWQKSGYGIVHRDGHRRCLSDATFDNDHIGIVDDVGNIYGRFRRKEIDGGPHIIITRLTKFEWDTGEFEPVPITHVLTRRPR